MCILIAKLVLFLCFDLTLPTETFLFLAKLQIYSAILSETKMFMSVKTNQNTEPKPVLYVVYIPKVLCFKKNDKILFKIVLYIHW